MIARYRVCFFAPDAIRPPATSIAILASEMHPTLNS
jgi:hypothetical protein